MSEKDEESFFEVGENGEVKLYDSFLDEVIDLDKYTGSGLVPFGSPFGDFDLNNLGKSEDSSEEEDN